MAKTVNNVKINATFTTAAAREQLTSGENLCTSLGKINKYLADLDAGEFTFPANGGNADTFAENSIDKFLKYNGVATDCNECTARGVYQANKSTLNTPGTFHSIEITPILITFDASFQLFFTGLKLYSRAYCPEPITGAPYWKPWTNVASGGNADTVDGLHADAFMQWLGYYSSGSILTIAAELNKSGAIYCSRSVTELPESNKFFFVNILNSDGTMQLTATGFDTGKTYTNRYDTVSKTWYGWSNVADGGNADTLDGKHASDFSQIISFSTSTDTKTAIGIPYKTTIYWCQAWTDYPVGLKDGQGVIIAVNYKSTSGGNTWCRQFFVTPSGSDKIYQRAVSGTSFGDWTNIADGGVAASVGTYTEAKIAALEARIAALEGK